MIYDDNTILTTHFEGDNSRMRQPAQNAKALVAVQSCSDQGICLPLPTLKEQVHIKP